MTSGALRILLVEDNPGDAMLVREMLRPSGAQIQVARTMAAALDLLPQSTFDMVLLDLGLPDSRGVDTYRRVAAAAPALPIIVLTGDADMGMAREAVGLGAQDYLYKDDVSENLLERCIAYALERARSRMLTEHLNTVLRAIRRLGQLIAHERDPHVLVERACELLIRTRGYDASWLLLKDPGGSGCLVTKGSIGDRVAEIPPDAKAPPSVCLSRALQVEDQVIIVAPETCKECGKHVEEPSLTSMTVAIRHGKQTYGGLCVRLPQRIPPTVEEQHLLRDIAADLGMALFNLDNAKKLQGLQDQLLQSQKMEAIGQLAGGVAHDFNNLLTVIQGSASLIKDDLPPGQSQEDLEQITQAAGRARDLTRQLLAFSRKQLIQPRVLNLNELLTNLERMLRRLIGEDIELSTVLDPAVHSVKLDPGQFEQIVINLAVNARDAMPRGGDLTIQTSEVDLDEIYAAEQLSVVPGRYVLVTVSDTGCGMTPEVRERLFEPFFSTKGKERGTGLGLSTVYGIVKQHSGSIWAYSELGTGATFKIYLPVHREGQPVGQGATDSEEAVLLRGGDETLLVVEDEPAVRSLVDRLLGRLGYRLLLAGDGQEAFQLASQHTGPIDLLLTDVVMPRLSGVEVARKLVGDRPGLKVLYMSGYSGNAIANHGVLDEGIRLLQKPFSMTQLAQVVRDVLDQ